MRRAYTATSPNQRTWSSSASPERCGKRGRAATSRQRYVPNCFGEDQAELQRKPDLQVYLYKGKAGVKSS